MRYLLYHYVYSLTYTLNTYISGDREHNTLTIHRSILYYMITTTPIPNIQEKHIHLKTYTYIYIHRKSKEVYHYIYIHYYIPYLLPLEY